MPITHALQPIDTGRLFVRNLRDNAGAFVGVIDVPAAVPTEHLAAARLSNRLWLDTSAPVPMRDRFGWKEFVPETNVTGLLRSLKFRTPALPDAFEIGIRACELKHEDAGRRWVIAFGAIQDIRGWPLAMQTDGLFELGLDGPSLVTRDPMRGQAMGSALREPLWGPHGKFGLAHSLEPETYPAFIQAERASNARRDDRYAQFLKMTGDRPEPLVYTREQQQELENSAQMVVRAILAGETVKSFQGLAGQPGLADSKEARTARSCMAP